MQKGTDLIQPCIDHIKSALDVDPWASKLAEKALRHYGRRGKWKTIDNGDGDLAYQCSECGELWVLNDGTPEENNMSYCPQCGAAMAPDKRCETCKCRSDDFTSA